MKKIFSVILLAIMICSAVVVAVSATSATLPIDITDQMKCSTVYEVYSQMLPVVRLDATFVSAADYDAALVGKAPSGGARTVTFTDWTFPYFFDDPFNLDDGVFYYDSTKWANVADPDDRAKLTYQIEVETAGKYEFVVLGCAQITDANLNLDDKDRGFCYSIDGGQMYQVNISDTRGIFKNYSYTYSSTELLAGEKPTTNGVNSDFFQPAYYYNIFADLTAGKHTFEFTHLVFSGDAMSAGNTGRLNFMGFYYQKAISEAEWIAYTYPETTATEAPVTTAAPQTTKAPETTKAPATTAAPEITEAPKADTTKAPAVTTAAGGDEGGCGSMMGIGFISLLIPVAIIIKKKKD